MSEYSNFLTMTLKNGKPEVGRYSKQSSAMRAERRSQHRKACMNAYWLDTCKDDLDALASPTKHVKYYKELRDDGLRVILLVLPEGSPRMKAKYCPKGKPANLAKALRKALPIWKPYIYSVVLGVEMMESLATPADAIWLLKEIRAAGWTGEVGIHLNSGDVYPDGEKYVVIDGKKLAFWDAAKQAGCKTFYYQHEHPKVSSNGAFLAKLKDVRSALRRAKSAAGKYVRVVSNEYAYFGRSPSSALVKKIKAEGFKIGAESLKEVKDFSNGGPACAAGDEDASE